MRKLKLMENLHGLQQLKQVLFTFNFDDGSSIGIYPNTALVFLDETGEEKLSDPNYKIFGLGGCCILAKDYIEKISKPWNELKKNNFETDNKPLHATDIKFSKKQITALNNFFISNQFGRFAVICSNDTHLDSNLLIDEMVYYSLHNRIGDILKWISFENIVIVFEHSERLKPQFEKYAGRINLSVKENDKDIDIDISHCVVNKQASFPGLELADLIIHTAGTTVRDKINNKINKFIERKDFDVIFNQIDNKYSSFFCIDKITFTPSN